MKRYLKIILISLTIFSLFIIIKNITLAKDYKCPEGLSPQECILWGLEQTGGETNYDTSIVGESESWSDAVISQKIGQIISYVLAFLGVIFLVISIYSGIQWMTAGGNEEKLKLARSRLMNAAIGFIIVVMAYAISNFIVSKIEFATGPSQSQLYPAGTPCTQVVEEGYHFNCLTTDECNLWLGQQLYMYACNNTRETCCKISNSQQSPSLDCIPSICNDSCAPDIGTCRGGECICLPMP